MANRIGGRYTILKKIGSGGMADVYLAYDTVLEREVAVKILRGTFSQDTVALLRFEREAEAASALTHDNIVDIYDVGEDGGEHYIVMEMVHGTTLKELLMRRGALDKYEAVSIMEQVASGLALAHDQKVIHRDVKPQNILVKSDGTAKIADFGIALAEDALQLTQSDSVLGSVHYLAPECSRGEQASIQSDIYALGIVFYELLTGKVPFRGESAVEIAMKHMREPLPSVLEYNPSLPNSIENIIRKASHKNKNLRYKDMHEFAEDLATCLLPERIDEPLWEPEDDESQDETLVFGQVDESSQSEEKPPKRKWIYGLVFVVVMLLGGGLWYLFGHGKPDPEILMPDLSGKKVEDARIILDELGLHVNPNYVYQYSDEFDYMEVIRTSPSEGQKVLVGSQVRLTVSQGKTYEIEDYTGMALSEVKSLLADQKIQVQVKKEARSDMKPGIVIRQELLKPGDRIKPDQRQEIVLVVSSDLEIFMPTDLIGKPVKTAEKMMSDLGAKVKTEKLTLDNLSLSELEKLEYGVVVRSNPMPGSYYVQENDSFVVLYYYDENDRPKEEPEKEKPEEKPAEEKPKPEEEEHGDEA